MSAAYKYKVSFNVKHVDKKSALYGLVSFDQSCKFGSLVDAHKYAKEMSGKRTSKIQVVGTPRIEII